MISSQEHFKRTKQLSESFHAWRQYISCKNNAYSKRVEYLKLFTKFYWTPLHWCSSSKTCSCRHDKKLWGSRGSKTKIEVSLLFNHTTVSTRLEKYIWDCSSTVQNADCKGKDEQMVFVTSSFLRFHWKTNRKQALDTKTGLRAKHFTTTTLSLLFYWRAKSFPSFVDKTGQQNRNDILVTPDIPLCVLERGSRVTQKGHLCLIGNWKDLQEESRDPRRVFKSCPHSREHSFQFNIQYPLESKRMDTRITWDCDEHGRLIGKDLLLGVLLKRDLNSELNLRFACRSST